MLFLMNISAISLFHEQWLEQCFKFTRVQIEESQSRINYLIIYIYYSFLLVLKEMLKLLSIFTSLWRCAPALLHELILYPFFWLSTPSPVAIHQVFQLYSITLHARSCKQ